METLAPAFLAALLAQSIDRTPWLAAILADRYERGSVLAGAAGAILLGNILAAVAGALVSPILNANARMLMLALALLFAAGGALLPMRTPDRLSGWRIGGFAAALLGIFILAFGDAAQFLAFGFAARGASPVAAAIGASLGCTVALVPAILMGEAAWMNLPLRPLRWTIGGLFALAGTIALLSAFRIL